MSTQFSIRTLNWPETVIGKRPRGRIASDSEKVPAEPSDCQTQMCRALHRMGYCSRRRRSTPLVWYPRASRPLRGATWAKYAQTAWQQQGPPLPCFPADLHRRLFAGRRFLFRLDLCAESLKPLLAEVVPELAIVHCSSHSSPTGKAGATGQAAHLGRKRRQRVRECWGNHCRRPDAREQFPVLKVPCVTEEKSMTFRAADLAGGFGSDDMAQPDDDRTSAQRHKDNQLQTSYTSTQLQSRLLATYHAARTSMEEQGVNTLYLALGMLS